MVALPARVIGISCPGIGCSGDNTAKKTEGFGGIKLAQLFGKNEVVNRVLISKGRAKNGLARVPNLQQDELIRECLNIILEFLKTLTCFE